MPPTFELTPSEAAKRFAAHLTSLSFCLDESSWPITALHTKSNSESMADSLTHDFPAWARSNTIRIAGDYSTFLDGLSKRLIYLLPRVRATSFKPVAEQIYTNRFGLRCANTFIPFAPETPDVFVPHQMLTDYLNRVFMNDQDREFVPMFLADIIQNPTRRPEYGLFIQGESSTGKSTIYQVLKAALGANHCWEKGSYTEPFEKFSEIWADHLVVFFDDAPAQKSTYLKLKHAITRKTMKVQIKGTQKLVERDVYSRVLVCSNPTAEGQLIGEKGERRFYVTELSTHAVSVEASEAFFVGFYQWLEEPGTAAHLYHWLKTIDLSTFKPGSMVRTAAHAEWLGLSSSSLEDCLKEFVTPEGDEAQSLFLSAQLFSYLADQGFKFPDMSDLKTKLNLLGYERKRRVIKGLNNDDRVFLWQPKKTTSLRAPSLTAEQEAEFVKKVLAQESALIKSVGQVFGNH